MGNLVSHLLPFLRTPHDVTRKTKKSYLWPSRENLVSHLRPLWRTLNEIILRIKKAIVSPPQFDKNEIIRHAPVIVDWLQGASENSGTSGDSTVSLLGFLQFAFQSGNIGKIYRLAATPDEALDIMLAACDISARVEDPDHQLARKILVGVFCELVYRSSRFPRCLLLDVQFTENTPHTTDDYAEVYSGNYNGQAVDLRIPKAMKEFDSQILHSRLFRKDAALWRTLPPDECIIPFLGVSNITFSDQAHVGLVSPKSEAERLARHIRSRMAQDVPPADFQIVPPTINWDTVLLTPDGHVRLLGFEGVAFEYVDVTEQPTSGCRLAFLAPELLEDTAKGHIKPSTSASDVWAFGCVCVELFNEGIRPYNDISDAGIKRRIKQGYHPPHTMMIPDDIWALAERCWDMSPMRRPSMEVLVDELIQAQNAPRDFLSYILVSLARDPSEDIHRKHALDRLTQMARNCNLWRITECNDLVAHHVFDVLHEARRIFPCERLAYFSQVLIGCNSGQYKLPMGTRSTLRIVMAQLASVFDEIPQSFHVTGVKLIPGFREFIRTGFADISKGTHRDREVAIKAIRILSWSIKPYAQKATKACSIPFVTNDHGF
ncbi:hypothetical protein NLI96_g1953 [Meripilus lineatus]|uniref:Protein kinase domain-containing protein n=1 Tax=Meripilus lineatus TaxID=2056292 RepID=A0AAD5YHV4_9APHY|nr:hypothetical protein NLI96_g1953 [Physisporinus lineatus]